MNKLLILLLICPSLLPAGILVDYSSPKTSSETPSLPQQPQREQSANDRLFDPQAIKNSKRVWLEGEALLWQASEDGLSFAIKSDSQTTIKNGHGKSPDFDWD